MKNRRKQSSVHFDFFSSQNAASDGRAEEWNRDCAEIDFLSSWNTASNECAEHPEMTIARRIILVRRGMQPGMGTRKRGIAIG
jgi:hypothetical protein